MSAFSSPQSNKYKWRKIANIPTT